MYVTSAVSSLFNPYDVARTAGVKANTDQTESQSSRLQEQSSANTRQQERVIQGEVISRQPIQNNRLSNTNDALSGRQFSQQQAGFGFNSQQAVNTYIGNQIRGEQIDRQGVDTTDSLIDVYV